MISDKQMEANRCNAKLSTGPTTESGRTISSMNRTSHGLTARRVVLADEDQAEFDELHNRLMSDYYPRTAIEEELVQELAAASWRLRRADRLETEYFDQGRFDELDKLRRYRTSIERAFHKAIDQLHKLQGGNAAQKAKIREQGFADAMEAMYKANLPRGEKRPASEDYELDLNLGAHLDPENGFVSQSDEDEDAA